MKEELWADGNLFNEKNLFVQRTEAIAQHNIWWTDLLNGKKKYFILQIKF